MTPTLEQFEAELARTEARMITPEPWDDMGDLYMWRAFLRGSLRRMREAAARDQLAADRRRLHQFLPLRKAVELVVRAFGVFIQQRRLRHEDVAVGLGHPAHQADDQALKGEDARAVVASHVVEGQHSNLSVVLQPGDDAESSAGETSPTTTSGAGL